MSALTFLGLAVMGVGAAVFIIFTTAQSLAYNNRKRRTAEYRMWIGMGVFWVGLLVLWLSAR